MLTHILVRVDIYHTDERTGGTSIKFETIGTQDAFKIALEELKLPIKECAHDDNKSVSKLIVETFHLTSQLDVWHGCKLLEHRENYKGLIKGKIR